jgi:hypothetical protein
MSQDTGIFQQQPSAVLNERALDQLADVQGDLGASATTNFGGYEPFVDEDIIARFLQVTPRRVLEMARNNEIPAHPIGRGTRKTWRFRISEIDAHFSREGKAASANLKSAVPGATRRKK